MHARRSWACASRVESHQLRLDSGGAKRPEPRFKPKRARATRRTDPKCKLLSVFYRRSAMRSVPNYVLATHAVGRTREETEAVRSAGLKKSHIHKSPMKRNTVRRCPDENGRHLHTARTHVDPIPFYTSRYSHRSTTPHPPLHRPTCPRATAAHMPHRRHIGPPLRRPVSGVPMRAGPGPGLVPCRSKTLSSDLDTGVASHRAPCTCRTCPRSCLLRLDSKHPPSTAVFSCSPLAAHTCSCSM